MYSNDPHRETVFYSLHHGLTTGFILHNLWHFTPEGGGGGSNMRQTCACGVSVSWQTPATSVLGHGKKILIVLYFRAPNDTQFVRLQCIWTEIHPLQVCPVHGVDPLNFIVWSVKKEKERNWEPWYSEYSGTSDQTPPSWETTSLFKTPFQNTLQSSVHISHYLK